jgi:glucokinase
MGERVLAGDIGGTKATLALFRLQEGGRLVLEREATAPTEAHASAAALVRDFLGPRSREVDAACLGVAGAVRDGAVRAPNLPWTVGRDEIRDLGIGSVEIINDVLATAWGIGELPEGCFAELSPGRPDPDGNRALIAAGTGLGEAILFRHAGAWVPAASEGGHSDFAPTDPLQAELLAHLDAIYGRTSFERVLSGPGLGNIYRFLVETGRGAESAEVAACRAAGDVPRIIAEEALRGPDTACALALEVFVRVYGAETGNLVLKALATGGVYIGGGIAPKILSRLRDGSFLESFWNKGRLSAVLREVPVRVILEPRAAVFGAARYLVRAG